MQKEKHNRAQESSPVECVFTTYITLHNGRRLYAKAYGLKAFCIPVHDDKK